MIPLCRERSSLHDITRTALPRTGKLSDRVTGDRWRSYDE